MASNKAQSLCQQLSYTTFLKEYSRKKTPLSFIIHVRKLQQKNQNNIAIKRK